MVTSAHMHLLWLPVVTVVTHGYTWLQSLPVVTRGYSGYQWLPVEGGKEGERGGRNTVTHSDLIITLPPVYSNLVSELCAMTLKSERELVYID